MNRNIFLLAIALLVSSPAGNSADYPFMSGRITDYYTMVNTQGLNRRHCSTEGNQIFAGQLWGSDCMPVTKKICRWGVGNHNNCLIPCVDGAGRKDLVGKIVRIPRRLCKYGPLAGNYINYIRVADVGSAVAGEHIDVFQGLCLREKGGNCLEYGTEADYRKYRGTDPRDETEPTVAAILKSMNVEASAGAPSSQLMQSQAGTVSR